MHSRQTILYGVFISPVHLVCADPSGLTDPVAICIISIGKAGSLLAIVELFRDQLVTLIILISVPLHNRFVQGFLHIGTVTHKVILERIDT
jgi:prephenate dehydratase